METITNYINEIALIKKHGLFATTLNNGDWMVGQANYIYLIKNNKYV